MRALNISTLVEHDLAFRGNRFNIYEGDIQLFIGVDIGDANIQLATLVFWINRPHEVRHNVQDLIFDIIVRQADYQSILLPKEQAEAIVIQGHVGFELDNVHCGLWL